MFIDPEKNNSSILTTSSLKSKVQKRLLQVTQKRQ